MSKAKKDFNFEKAMDELSLLVDKMEKGDLSLEESIRYFEQGMKITQDCQSALKKAEQKVQILIEKNNTLQLEDFENDQED